MGPGGRVPGFEAVGEELVTENFGQPLDVLALVIAKGGGRIERETDPAGQHSALLRHELDLQDHTLRQSRSRGSFLDDAWDAGRLSQELPSEAGWQTAAVFWEGACPAQTTRRVAFVGGSSTGGAYQLGQAPEAFFAAQAHLALCAQAGEVEGVGFETTNFGTGDSNTFTISRTLDQVLDQSRAELLVAYVGVNDLLTRHHSQTRKQREAALAARGQAVGGLASLSRRLRALTGLALLVKPLPDQADNVSAVPLADAEENHRRIAALAAARGAKVLLLTEQLGSGLAWELQGYAEMQRRIAAENAHVAWADAGAMLGGQQQVDALLLDRNHLSREGNARFGQALAPVIAAQLSE